MLLTDLNIITRQYWLPDRLENWTTISLSNQQNQSKITYSRNWNGCLDSCSHQSSSVDEDNDCHSSIRNNSGHGSCSDSVRTRKFWLRMSPLELPLRRSRASTPWPPRSAARCQALPADARRDLPGQPEAEKRSRSLSEFILINIILAYGHSVTLLFVKPSWGYRVEIILY